MVTVMVTVGKVAVCAVECVHSAPIHEQKTYYILYIQYKIYLIEQAASKYPIIIRTRATRRLASFRVGYLICCVRAWR